MQRLPIGNLVDIPSIAIVPLPSTIPLVGYIPLCPRDEEERKELEKLHLDWIGYRRVNGKDMLAVEVKITEDLLHAKPKSEPVPTSQPKPVPLPKPEPLTLSRRKYKYHYEPMSMKVSYAEINSNICLCRSCRKER